MMARRNNVAMGESNDNIDHKKMIITWISFADEVIDKIFFLIACIKKDDVLTFFILGPIWTIFSALSRISFFALYLFSAEVYLVPSVILCYIYRMKALNISWIHPGTIPFQYLKTVFAIQYSTLSLIGSQFIFLKWRGSILDLGGEFRQTRIHLFWAFWSLSFKFFHKRGNHKEHS